MQKSILVIAVLSLGALLQANAVNLNTCTACHGENFEKHAMGKSKIVKDLSEEEIATALHGYKNGTYGGSMKAVMQGQVKKVKDLDELAKVVYQKTHANTKKNISEAKEKIINLYKKRNNCLEKASTEKEMNKCLEIK